MLMKNSDDIIGNRTQGRREMIIINATLLRLLCVKSMELVVNGLNLLYTLNSKHARSKCSQFPFNPSTPELNLSAQRFLTRFFTGDFAS
jgi:hypothetical protein